MYITVYIYIYIDICFNFLSHLSYSKYVYILYYIILYLSNCHHQHHPLDLVNHFSTYQYFL